MGLLMLASCQKPVEGCLDTRADNYLPDANLNDGSCSYTGRVYFYYTSATANYFLNLGISNLILVVDGDFLGTQKVYSYTVPFDCGDTSNLSDTLDLGLKAYESFELVVRNPNNGDTISLYNFEVQGGVCNGIEILY